MVDLFSRMLSNSGAQRARWLSLAAIAAGSTIWCTHFVAILAYRPHLPVTFDFTLTLVSLLVAALGAGVGFALAGSREMRFAPAAGGAVLGLALAGMHYAGMLAYRVEGLVQWHRLCRGVGRHRRRPFGARDPSGGGSPDQAWASFRDRLPRRRDRGFAFHRHDRAAGSALLIDDAATASIFAPALAIAVAGVAMLVIGMGVVSYMIEDRVTAESDKRLRRMALYDYLTGLPNRAGFNEHLTQAISSGDAIALIAIDLDRFSEVNDLCGHKVGDETLKIYARRLTNTLRVGEYAARLGADEFALIHRLRGEDDLKALLGKLSQVFQEAVRIGDFAFTLGASLGVALYPDHAATAESLISNGDLALARAKASRSEKICCYDPSMDERVRERRRLAAELRDAIANAQLEIYYQPQVSVATGRIHGFEALLRWRHPQRGFIPPCDFIPLAEESGLIAEIGEWVLRKACVDAASWEQRFRVAVNLSPVQMSHTDLPSLIQRALNDAGLDAERLELELTESTLIADKVHSLDVIERIKALGATIAIDDFGTGYSSLDTLRAFPFDKIKLDRSFMREIETSPQAMAILRAVLALGRSLDVTVIAEGIETDGQLAMLKEGCGEAQGYLLGRPAPLSAIVASGAIRLKSDATLSSLSVSAKARASLGVKAAHVRSEPPQRLAVGL